MIRSNSVRTGFSLLELVVVIAVVVVLAAILLPAVRAVRDLANTAKCASNLRQIGAFVFQFAEDNHGQLPGQGHYGSGSCSWCDIINTALLADEKVQLPRMTDPPGSNLLCPAYDPPPASWHRCFTFNVYGMGGTLDTTTSPPTSQYGLVYAPPSRLGPAFASWTYVTLGAAVSRFSNLGDKVLLQENERSSDSCNAVYPNGVLVQGDTASYPDFCAAGGTFAFRHRGGHMANFLYLDQHVDCQRCSGDLNVSSRYAF